MLKSRDINLFEVLIAIIIGVIAALLLKNKEGK